jgi:hypothetical protein
MKTIFNDFVAIILAVVFSTTMINSQAALMSSRDTCNMYAAALHSESYTVLSQALGNSQPLYL